MVTISHEVRCKKEYSKKAHLHCSAIVWIIKVEIYHWEAFVIRGVERTLLHNVIIIQLRGGAVSVCKKKK